MHYLPPGRPVNNLKKILYFVLTGFSGFIHLHFKLSQLFEIQEKFVIGRGLSKQRIDVAF